MFDQKIIDLGMNNLV